MPSHRGRHSAPTDQVAFDRPMGLEDYRALAFGPIVRQRRNMAEIDIETVAETAGLSVEEVELIETSQVFPELPVLLRLANAVKSDLAELLHETRPVGMRRMEGVQWFGIADRAMAS
jgi:transcriptional regulator with XRE-family HTH domain